MVAGRQPDRQPPRRRARLSGYSSPTGHFSNVPQIERGDGGCRGAGGAGFLGPHLSRRVVDAGAGVRATLHNKPLVLTDPRIDYITVDLNQPEDCARAMQGIDYVFMAAANT